MGADKAVMLVVTLSLILLSMQAPAALSKPSPGGAQPKTSPANAPVASKPSTKVAPTSPGTNAQPKSEVPRAASAKAEPAASVPAMEIAARKQRESSERQAESIFGKPESGAGFFRREIRWPERAGGTRPQ